MYTPPTLPAIQLYQWWAVSIHWTGPLDRNTGLDYWTHLWPNDWRSFPYYTCMHAICACAFLRTLRVSFFMLVYKIMSGTPSALIVVDSNSNYSFLECDYEERAVSISGSPLKVVSSEHYRLSDHCFRNSKLCKECSKSVVELAFRVQIASIHLEWVSIRTIIIFPCTGPAQSRWKRAHGLVGQLHGCNRANDGMDWRSWQAEHCWMVHSISRPPYVHPSKSFHSCGTRMTFMKLSEYRQYGDSSTPRQTTFVD